MRTKKSKVIKAEKFLENKYCIQWDEHFGVILVDGQVADDNQLMVIRHAFNVHYDEDIADSQLMVALNIIAKNKRVHWWLDWLEALPEWDKKDRVKKLAKLITGTKKELYRIYILKWLLGSIARANDPNALVKAMLILVGAQDIGKSSLLRALAPAPDFNRYVFNDSLRIDQLRKNPADFYSSILGCIICEFAEMVGNQKNNVDALKNMLGATHIRARVAYGRLPSEIPVSTIFAGTTNAIDGFLKDHTGNVRFMVLPCQEFGVGDGLGISYVEKNLEQIWAQVMSANQRGEPHWIDDVVVRAAQQEENQDHIYLDHVSSQLVNWIKECDREYLKTEEIGNLKFGPGIKAQDHQIKAAMQRCGWTKAHSYKFTPGKGKARRQLPNCWVSPTALTLGGEKENGDASNADIAAYIYDLMSKKGKRGNA